MKTSITLSTLLVLACGAFPLNAYAQKGMGEPTGVARQAVRPEIVTVSGKLVEIKTGPCEKTTGRSPIGSHILLESANGEKLNIHLGPAAAVADTVAKLSPGQEVTVKAFCTDKMPDRQYIAQSLTFGKTTVELRDSELRPVWAGGRNATAMAVDRLPEPDYERQPTDPAWLPTVVRFHGHLGPSVVAGARMGMAGLRAVDAKGYFDVEVTCEGPFAQPPQACFLDGLQVATGATLGKRTLQWVQADRIAVRFKNTRTGKTAVLRPTPALLTLLTSLKAQPKIVGADSGDAQKAAHAHLESVARKLAAMPEREIITVESDR